MRVIVVGAGVIGAAVAESLAVRGAEVTVLDMRSPGRGASQASAGVLAPYTEAHGKTPLLELCTRSLDLFDPFILGAGERSGRSIDYVRSGTLEVALQDSEVGLLKSAKTWLDRNGVGNEWLAEDALRVAEPAVSHAARGALLIHTHGFVRVSALVAALVQSARVSGAQFQSPVEALEITPAAGRVDIRAGARRYTADHVVIAAGSWSSRIRVAGVAVPPVRPIRGQLLHLQWAGESPPARVVWGTACYTVPWSDGTLLVGATVEDVGFDEASTVAGVQTLTAAVTELLPDARHAALREVRAGLRPSTLDGLPMIGPLGSAPNVTIASGHYRNGILLAPLTASLVSRYLLDGVTDPAMAVTSPNRFLASASPSGVPR